MPRLTLAIWITCLHCGEVPVFAGTPEHGAILAVTSALEKGHAPLGAMTCPRCGGEVRGKDVRL